MYYDKDLTITHDNAADYKQIRWVDGLIFIDQGVYFYAPHLVYAKHLILGKGAEADTPVLFMVKASLDLFDQSKLTAVRMGRLGVVMLREGSLLNTPELTTINGLVVYDQTKIDAPKLTSIRGLYVEKNAQVAMPALTNIGYLLIEVGATVSAPELTHIDGGLKIREGGELIAPLLVREGIADTEIKKNNILRATP